MSESPPPLPRRGFPSAFAPRPVRTECGSGGEADGLSRPPVVPSPSTDEPSTSTAPPVRRGFPSAFAPRPVPVVTRPPEEKRPPTTPSPPPPSTVPERLIPSPVAVVPEEETAVEVSAVTPPPPRRCIWCPYVSEEGERHEIPMGEFHLHIIGCRARHFMHPDLVQMTRCRYNGMHYIPAPELAFHERLCKDERRAQIEEQIKTDPIAVVVFEGSSDSESSESDDEGWLKVKRPTVDVPVTTDKEGEETKKEEEEVVGEEEYGRVVHDLIQI